MKIITLDARVNSELDWDFSLQEDEPIQWNIECGLFDQLPRPLQDEMQFRTLELAMHHFCDAVWEPYRAQTHAVSLYRGTPDFSSQFQADPLASRDMAADYLRLLTDTMPEGMPLVLEFDATGIEGLLLQAQLLSRSCYQRFKLKVKGAAIPTHVTGKEKIAVCLPEKGIAIPALDQAMQKLHDSKTPYRIIPEAFLTQEWDGLDELIICKQQTSPQGFRRVQGFVAAGGTIIDVNHS